MTTRFGMSPAPGAPGWTRVRGGHHYCAFGKHHVDATNERPVFSFFVDNLTCTMTVCLACAEHTAETGTLPEVVAS